MTDQDDQVDAALKLAVQTGLAIVSEHERQNKHIGTHVNFPEVNEFASGLPLFTVHLVSETAPKNYGLIFSGDIRPDKIPDWQQYYELAQTHPALVKYYSDYAVHEFNTEEEQSVRTIMHMFMIGHTITNLIDRFIHITHQTEFDEVAFRKIYLQWKEGAFATRLCFDVVIPILLVDFDFDEIDLPEDARIERMDDHFQLARSRESRYTVSANGSVVGAATHAFIITNWSVPNAPLQQRSHLMGRLETFSNVIPLIDNLFSALRTITGVQTGYGQLIARHNEWGDSWIAYLPDIEIVELRAYPDTFEDFGWLRIPPVLTKVQCEKMGDIYSALVNSPNNQLMVAGRRMNAAYLRVSEEDSILDIVIGLEALLVKDGRTGEITHKLAMRLAALCKMQPFEQYTPQEVFALCKKLYSLRSNAAHGTHSIDKNRNVKLEKTDNEIPLVNSGLALLRHALAFLCIHPEFLDSAKFDVYLLENG